MSSKALTAMVASMTSYFTKVRENTVPLVFDAAINIAGNSTKQYDLKTLMTDHAKYNLLSAKVTVLLLNSDVGTPTKDMYINSEATITIGIAATGIIVVQNSSTNSARVVVRIDRPTVQL